MQFTSAPVMGLTVVVCLRKNGCGVLLGDCRGRLLFIHTVTPLQYGFLGSGRLPIAAPNVRLGAGDVWPRHPGGIMA